LTHNSGGKFQPITPAAMASVTPSYRGKSTLEIKIFRCYPLIIRFTPVIHCKEENHQQLLAALPIPNLLDREHFTQTKVKVSPGEKQTDRSPALAILTYHREPLEWRFCAVARIVTQQKTPRFPTTVSQRGHF
jgi:hypothetical protein